MELPSNNCKFRKQKCIGLLVDSLHAFNLGILKTWVALATWRLILADVFGVGAGKTKHELVQGSVSMLAKRLAKWYESRRRLHPLERLSEMQALTLPMLVSEEDPGLKAKAAETNGVLPLHFVRAARVLSGGPKWGSVGGQRFSAG